MSTVFWHTDCREMICLRTHPNKLKFTTLYRSTFYSIVKDQFVRCLQSDNQISILSETANISGCNGENLSKNWTRKDDGRKLFQVFFLLVN